MAQTQTPYQKPVLPDSQPAGEDLSAKQFCAMKMNSDGQYVTAGAGEASDGPLQTTTATVGETVVVERLGISKFVAGAAVNATQFLEVGTGGKYIPLASGKCVGKCIVGASGDGKIGSMIPLPTP